MSHYHCNDCGMGILEINCSKCGTELQHATIKDKQGKKVEVLECPKKCGMIKSPTCCGHDMKVKHA